MKDRSGQQLDNYNLLRLLGSGNFGEVYLAENQYRKVQVAVKILQVHFSIEEFQQFINEARIFRLRHPHIVSVLDFGVERTTGTPFIAMDYAPGGTLRQRHPKGTQVPLKTIILYVKQVADALQFAHEENLVHRDVKPENMLLDQNNNILLSDFGISTVSQSGLLSVSTSAETAGTPYYMAPEQFLGKASRASDQYALGSIVYEWLSGNCPFKGTVYELFGQHMQATPPPLSLDIPDLTPAVEQVITRALTKDPKSRFPSIHDFALALEEASAHMPGTYHAVPIDIKTTEQWFDEGNTYYRHQQYNEAIIAYSHALTLDVLDSRLYNNRGLAYKNIQDYHKAVSDFDRAISLKPDDARAYNNRGLAYKSLLEYNEALKDFDQAINLAPDDANTYYNRGNVYASLKDLRSANKNYDQALKLDPHHQKARTARDNTQRLLGETRR